VRSTHKKVKGFAPLQMSWGRFLIDAVFRRGDTHSNHSDTAQKMIRHIVARIRKHYRADVPIIIRMDSGFFDQKIFEVCEEIKVGYICGGKLYQDITDYVAGLDSSLWRPYQRRWEYVELGDRRGSWKEFRRAVFYRSKCNEHQLLFDFARPGTILYTNLGMGKAIDEQLKEWGQDDLLETEKIIDLYQDRGRDELVHRALKDFGFEELPFKCFAPNAAFC
jgi:hypothetical protein